MLGIFCHPHAAHLCAADYQWEGIYGQLYLTHPEGTRHLRDPGSIYDRNGKLLAYSELSYSVTIEDNGIYTSTSEKKPADERGAEHCHPHG